MREVNITKYEAYDGTIFEHDIDCKLYEKTLRGNHCVNLRNFEITFPMQDQITNCRAYLIHSENEFKMLSDYIYDEFSEPSDCCNDYDGNGWYVLQYDDCGYAWITKLSNIVHDWSLVLDKIATYTMDFKEV